MIKLIATDLDGTMLDDSKRLPENFDKVLQDLNSRHIRFAVSSGRSFCTLKKQFDRYVDDLIFICDNGAYVYDKGEVVSMSVLPEDAVRSIIRCCQKMGLIILLCGKHGTWHNATDEATLGEIRKYYLNEQHLDELSSFDDDIFKVAVFERGGSIENTAYPRLSAKYGDYFNVQLSGDRWVDIMTKGTTKGSALHKMQNRLGVDYGETMSFGDYLNDIEMLENSYYSFSMENSHSLVKKAANFSTGSNNDNSVMKEIIKLCLEQ
ncbi:HAD family hydrolase [Ruminococcus sp.]|uniref:HAD family hydrolase n=1 Tax=Ruminococcus sp. TaxID=41978 RepID=UPI0025DF7C26|nr:HAD family hydrolase [Ruminococcus sp.]MBQ8965680.1 HAD family hydrolase [Ruminococcus sp.]